jgi:hypothetical protein
LLKAILGRIMIFMPDDSQIAVSPSEYWEATLATQAQRLYVSFCELASGALDYAEGLSLLRRDERRQGAARLNWAGTAFYYSLVHSARFLVFTAIGDFPTRHDKLAQVFGPADQGEVQTNWLQSFASGQRGCSATLSQLSAFWAAGADDQRAVRIREHLGWFSEALMRARSLRNENNYEALLIAHEYKHEHLGTSFKLLAETMSRVAHQALDLVVKMYSRRLWSEAKRGDTQVVQAAFIRHYVQTRIVEPTRNWYGTDQFVVADAIERIMQPLLELPKGNDCDVSCIEKMVGTDLFAPKVGLMSKFKKEICDLRTFADRCPSLPPTS